MATETKAISSQISDMSLEDMAALLEAMVARSEALKEPNLSFLLSVANEEARSCAGLPEIEPPSSFYETDAATTEALESVGEFEL